MSVDRYAVLFKTVSMTDFERRQLMRVLKAAPSADVYLMVDETRNHSGPIDFDRVVRYRESDMAELGFPMIAEGALFWYNADYPLYHFQHFQPGYDMIVMIEYDVVPNVDLDWLVQDCRDKGIDFLGEPIAKPLDDYWWIGTMLRFYRKERVRPHLICAAIFSATAVRHLAACRKRQALDYDLADATQWPIGETFVGTELSVGGFRLQALSVYGSLTRYDWWPPTHEAELSDFTSDLFVHPVLVGRRYINSLFKSNIPSGLIVAVKLGLAWVTRNVRRRFGPLTGASSALEVERLTL